MYGNIVRPTHRVQTHHSDRQQPISPGDVGGGGNTANTRIQETLGLLLLPPNPTLLEKLLHVLCNRDLGGCRVRTGGARGRARLCFLLGLGLFSPWVCHRTSVLAAVAL